MQNNKNFVLHTINYNTKNANSNPSELCKLLRLPLEKNFLDINSIPVVQSGLKTTLLKEKTFLDTNLNAEMLRTSQNIYTKSEVAKILQSKHSLNKNKIYTTHSACTKFFAGGKDATPSNSYVSVNKNENGKYFLKGLASCKCVWRCVNCAPKIMNERKKQVYTILKRHSKKNLLAGFLTLTIPHKRNDKLKDSLDLLNESWRTFQQSRYFRQFKKNYSYLGQLKTLEITRTDSNGWHPHLHIVFLYDIKNPLKKYLQLEQNNLLLHFVNFLKNKGIKSSIKSQDAKILDNDFKVSEYLAKWDIAKELTQLEKKTSNNKKIHSFTPFEILKYLTLIDKVKDPKNATKLNDLKKKLFYLWKEYIDATKGRTRFLISPKLYKIYNVKKLNDSELLANSEKKSIPELVISFQVMKQINKRNLTKFLIPIYSKFKTKGVLKFLDSHKIDYHVKNDFYKKYFKSPKNIHTLIHKVNVIF